MNTIGQTISQLKKIKQSMRRYPFLYETISKICMDIRRIHMRLKLINYNKNKENDQISAICRGMEYSYEEGKKCLNNSGDKKHIAFLVTEYEEINNTGDKYSAISLGEQLKAVDDKVLVSYYVRDPRMEWANVGKDVDAIIIMDPEIDKYILRRLKGKKIIWIRGNYDTWIKKGHLNRCEHIIVTSEILKKKLVEQGYGDKVLEVIHLGIPIDVQRKIARVVEWPSVRKKDVVFVGNIYDVERDIVKYLDVASIRSFCFYGNIKDKAHPWQKYNQGKLIHDNITSVYLDAKIVIEDIAPFNRGTVNLRVFEAAASGCLVISNYDEALVELFGDAIELYRTREELNQKINYYLEHEDERRLKAMQLREIVMQKYTFKDEASKLIDKINKICSISMEE